MKRALYTGSFDPLTLGHLDLIHRAAVTFEHLTIGVGVNPTKTYLFTLVERVYMIKAAVRAPNISVIPIPHGRLSVDVAYELGAVLIKGVRMGADLDYERLMDSVNHAHNHDLDTFILPARPALQHISSTAAKEVVKLNGVSEAFVPLNVKAALERKLVGQTRIGLTGTIASGKSTVMSELLKLSTPERPIHNIDLDAIASDILFTRMEDAYVLLRAQIRDELGLPEWNRKNLGTAIFADVESRTYIDRTIRPAMMTQIRAHLVGKTGLIVFNGALLAEANLLSLVNNQIALLDVGYHDQIMRLAARGHNPDQIGRRIGAQYSTAKKLSAIQCAMDLDKFGKVCQYDTSIMSAQAIAQNVLSNHLNTTIQ